MVKKKSTPASIVEETDLRPISRRGYRCLTTVRLFPNWDPANAVTWLKIGEARLRSARDGRADGRWLLEAYLTAGTTDFEHDSAYAIRLPLIGVQFEGVDYHATRVSAWVDPGNDFEDFHVPRPGYNPMALPNAEKCTDKRCEEPHVIVPEGFYVPPFDADLYAAVRGKRVEIRFDLVSEE
jgi:hypothetical protein